MIKVYGFLIVGVTLVQLLNFIFVKFGSTESTQLISNLKLVLYTLPLQIIASMAFVYFYSIGVKSDISYFYLTLSSMGLTSVIALVISATVVGAKAPTVLDVGSCLLVLSGLVLFAYSKSIK